MRWPFSRRDRKLEIPPVETQQWTVARANDGGQPLLVRINESVRRLAGHPGLPIKLGFAIPLNHPREGGLPDAQENEQLGAIEDLLVARVLRSGPGVFALALTNGVMKEYVFYVASGLDIAALHAEVQQRVSSHEVQCMAIEDPAWESYRDFSP